MPFTIAVGTEFTGSVIKMTASTHVITGLMMNISAIHVDSTGAPGTVSLVDDAGNEFYSVSLATATDHDEVS